MRTKLIILLFLLLSVSLFIPGSSIRAAILYEWLDGNGDITVDYSWGPFTAGGFSCDPSYNGGDDRIDGCTPVAGSTVGIRMTIENFPANTLVSAISVSFAFDPTRSHTTEPEALMYIRANGIGVNLDYHQQQGLSADTETLTWTGTAFTITELFIYGFVRNNNGADGSYFRVTAITLESPDGGEYVHPIAPPDRDAWGDMNMCVPLLDCSPVIASFSTSPEQFAYAGISGEVTRVDRVGWGECADILHSDSIDPLGQFCAIRVPPSVHGESSTADYLYTLGNNRYSLLGSINQGTMDFYVVEIYNASEDITFQYLVDSASEYITVGTTIEAGCIIGKTLKMRGVQFNTDISNLTPLASEGVVILRAIDGSNDEVEIISLLTLDPIAGNACNVDPEHADCLGDSALEHPADWQTSGQVGWNEPGATLGQNASIRMTMNLDDAREPRMRVGGRAFSGTGSMELRIGLTTQSFDVASGQTQDYEIAGDVHQPDAGIFYSIIVTNTGDVSLDLDYVCIAFTLDADSNPTNDNPPNCYFQNNSFSDGLLFWTPDGDVFTYDGELRMPTGQFFYQDATLHPGDYIITVTAAIWHYNTYELDPTDTTGNVAMEYSFPGGASYSSIETATVADFADGNNEYTFSATFNLVDSETGTFHFRPTLASMDSDVRGVAIREVCVNPDDGDWNNPEGTTDEPFPEFDENCEAIEHPSGTTLTTWIPWLWHNFSQFFDCHLMVLLNKMMELGNKTYRLIGWNARYWQATTHLGVEWMGYDVMPYLGGYLANSAGSVYITNNNEASCDWWNIICTLQNLADNVILKLLEWLLDTLGFLIRIFFTVLAKIFGLFIDWMFFGRDVLFTIVTAYNNATPQQVEGMPNCSANEDHMICWLVFTSEQTIFSGTPGALIMPLITSLVTIILTLKLAIRIRQMLQEAAGVA